MRKLFILIGLFVALVLNGQVVKTSVVYAQPGGSSYPIILDDGNTVMWFAFEQDVTVTGDHVTNWGDISGNNNDLKNVGGTPHLLGTGILFDGIGDYLKTDAIVLDRPEMIYVVLKQVTWTEDDALFDGLTILSAEIVQGYGESPSLAYMGWSTTQTDLVLDTWGILRLNVIDGTSSFQINTVDAHTTTDDYGDMEGFIIGARGAGADAWSNIEVKEIIIRKITDTAPNQTLIYDYLNNKHSLGLSMWLIILLIPMILPKYKKRFNKSLKIAA